MKNILEKRKYTAFDLVRLSFRVSPMYTIVTSAIPIIGFSMSGIMIYGTAYFIDTAISIVQNNADFSAIFLPVLCLLGITLYWTFMGRVSDILGFFRDIYYKRKLTPMMIERVASLSYKHIENEKDADVISRVSSGFSSKVTELMNSVVSVANLAASTLSVVLTVCFSAWWAGLIIVAATVPLIIEAVKGGRRIYEADRDTTRLDRESGYIAGVISSRDGIEEREVYGYAEKLNGVYLEKYHKSRKLHLKVDLKNMIGFKAGGVFGSIISALVIASMVPAAAAGKIEYSMFISLIGGIIALSRQLSWGVSGPVSQAVRNLEYLNDLTKFMEMETVDDVTALPLSGIKFERIEFKDVSFSYPETDKIILDKINFTIEKEKHYSFVGANGAGKTTITKLITGLYTNYSGEIYVDGRNLREFSQGELKGLSTVVYQDFAKFYCTLYDNIAIGDLTASEEGASESKIAGAIKLIGLTDATEKLKNKEKTYLGKVHTDGEDISGGEWQRIAMARSIVSSAPLRILDEPTAALDPLSESRIYTQFEEISKGATTIFISHRLGSTKLADIIFVLADGKIAEHGNHAELMRKNGVYAEMFNAQAEWYTSETVNESEPKGGEINA
ncbi:HlyB/MsbA family ABC transporter [Clostridia bacterium]|nr:HlyB/MsbA family ABC transporter [Clostridia bacterium]